MLTGSIARCSARLLLGCPTCSERVSEPPLLTSGVRAPRCSDRHNHAGRAQPPTRPLGVRPSVAAKFGARCRTRSRLKSCLTSCTASTVPRWNDSDQSCCRQSLTPYPRQPSAAPNALAVRGRPHTLQPASHGRRHACALRAPLRLPLRFDLVMSAAEHSIRVVGCHARRGGSHRACRGRRAAGSRASTPHEPVHRRL